MRPRPGFPGATMPPMWNRLVAMVRGFYADNLSTRGEEEREFLQTRLCLLSRVGCVLACAVAVYHFVSVIPGGAGAALSAGVLLVVWLATARGRWSPAALRATEVSTGIFLCSLHAAVFTSEPALRVFPDKPVLAATNLLFLRAILIPSTAAWTVAFGLGCSAPVLVLGWGALQRWAAATPAVDPVRELVISAQWLLLATTVSGFTSFVLYRLRHNIREARKLGQYTLEEKLGEGGMGVVYRARHALLRRPTAIKLLRPGTASEASIARFEAEVQQTSRLSHPNTIAIFDYGHTPDGVFYYAMEFLEGLDLERLVRRHGPLPPARAVHILEQVAASLTEAHECGLIHRDIKPGNVFLCARGGRKDVVKLLDFGLVKSLGRPSTPGGSGNFDIAGTPAYMAPETLQSPPALDARADLYAVGALAYFLLVGRPPFVGSSAEEIFVQHLQATPIRPSEVLGHPIPVGLEDLVLGCLSKRPDSRPASARELGKLLRALPPGPGGPWLDEQAATWWEVEAPGLAAAPDPGSLATPAATTLDVLPGAPPPPRTLRADPGR